MLMGFPGPSNMEYVTISCHKQVLVSGLMCMTGGKPVTKHSSDIVYRLTHLKENYGNSNSSTIGNQFNIDYMQASYMKHNTYNFFKSDNDNGILTNELDAMALGRMHSPL